MDQALVGNRAFFKTGGSRLSNAESKIPPGFLGWLSYLVETHRSRLAAIARAQGLEKEDALDAVQEAFETFMLLPQARELVENEDDSARLLTVIVKNEARNHRRKSRRRSAFHVDGNYESKIIGDGKESPEELILAAEKHITLLGCMKKLKEIQQQVITLRMLEGNGGIEVAKELGVKEGHVATILNRAKAALKECLLS